ncbi:MAG: 2-C-methyl-D-erythritol 4-phosphate cytidylyltransferase [Deltaproteobacteria bacterium]|jgi:2-C-methyl-D-erythritol 4-phosphate cytidylyltransferase/2-C-methyl-D-erythritol 2,4-cyclodiphosphate synthase|nr:2-C-methyl-D-erythritol 4-phosphate cytidylyltransferase [Deltaproteobacteria bacterium]
MNIWAILLAAGAGSRCAVPGASRPKQFLKLNGFPLFWRPASSLARLAPLSGIIFVLPPRPEGGPDSFEEGIRRLEATLPGQTLGLPWRTAAGGPRRQDSVWNGLAALPADCEAVLIHDAARPFASPALMARVLAALLEGRPAVIPAVPVTDTIKSVREERSDGNLWVEGTCPRQRLRAVQTPQGFAKKELLKAHLRARELGLSATDDAALLEADGVPVLVLEGEESNRKITTVADLALLRLEEPSVPRIPCTGLGYDVHRYGGDRPFVLGGVPIACSFALCAHSDGDALLHALMDALLGCVGAGDIGEFFPDTDPAHEGVSSSVLLAETLALCRRQGLQISHVDITVIAQVPRIAPQRRAIAANVAKLLQLPLSRVSIKATTEESLGFTGEKKGLKVLALVTGSRPDEASGSFSLDFP